MSEADGKDIDCAPKRVSHSLLDPLILPLVRPVYAMLPIPKRFPPEGIIAIGHLLAIAGAAGFAYSYVMWWGGLLAAIGVVGNHVADMVDGTHARQSGQCRNGGELLDHFTDPLSFSYWMVGLGVAAGRLELSIATIIIIYATAVLTNIKAKIVGSFTLNWFGPTEFKAMLAIFGLTMMGMALAGQPGDVLREVAMWFMVGLTAVGVVQLVIGLVSGVREVNAADKKPDTTEWVQGGDKK